MNRMVMAILGLVLMFSVSHQSLAQLRAVDDTGKTVILAVPAERVVSLAPNLTEILFHIQGGSKIVGVSEYSDFPLSASQIRKVGASNQLDIEGILSLEPDLVVAWESGNPAEDLAQLERLGITVFRTESRTIQDIASLMRSLGILTGAADLGNERATKFINDTTSIRESYSQRENLRVFYQIWSDPIYTLNGQHLISRLIEHCGGTNIFHEVETLAPVVSTESVIERDPQVIIAGGYAGETPPWLANWNQWSSISAVRNSRLYTVDTDQLSRMGPRIVAGMKELCVTIDQARNAN